MNSKRLSRLKAPALVIFGFTAVHLVFFRAPSEKQMVTRLQEHKAEFEQLRVMLQQDKNIRIIAYEWMDAKTLPASGRPRAIGISEQRLAQYRALMKKLGVAICIRDQGKQAQEYFRFRVFGGGFTDTSWSMGYAWSHGRLTPVVGSAYKQRPRRDSMHFSQVEGSWYMYHLR